MAQPAFGNTDAGRNALSWLRQSAGSAIQSWQFWAPFVLACVLTFAVEQGWEWLMHSGESDRPVSQSFMDVGFIYQRLITAGPRRSQPRYTAIVAIDTENEPASIGVNNVCEQREFIARLLKAIAAASPSVIVIDKYFGRNTCDRNPAGTQALIQAVGDVVQSGTPVVVGRVVNETGAVVPALSFESSRPNLPIESLVNVHVDERRLALLFSASDAQTAHRWPTLSFAAARAHNPTLFEESSRLKRIAEQNLYPYVGFLSPSSFSKHSYSAMKMLCGDSANAATDWRACVPVAADANRGLRARVVLIGEDAPTVDRHHTVIGDVPGLILQANYIEALLDDRVFDPAPVWVNYLVGFGIFLLFEMVLLFAGSFLATLVAAVMVLGFAVFVCYLAVVHVGVYVNPVTIGLLAVVVRILGQVPDRVRARSKA